MIDRFVETLIAFRFGDFDRGARDDTRAVILERGYESACLRSGSSYDNRSSCKRLIHGLSRELAPRSINCAASDEPMASASPGDPESCSRNIFAPSGVDTSPSSFRVPSSMT